jgi:hypothetical protein
LSKYSRFLEPGVGGVGNGFKISISFLMEAKSRECRLAIFSLLHALAVSIVPASHAGKIGLCVEINDLLSFQYMFSSTYISQPIWWIL